MFAQLSQIGAKPGQLTMPAGRAVQNELKRHYRENQALPVKHAGDKRNYWLEVMRSVQNPTEGAGGRTVTVSVTHPTIRQKLLGGTIFAKRAKALTIPVSAAAYEAGRAATLEHELGKKLVALMHGESGVLATIGDQGQVDVHYVLRKSVNQKPEPRAIPSVATLTRIALDTMRERLARLVRRAQGK